MIDQFQFEEMEFPASTRRALLCVSSAMLVAYATSAYFLIRDTERGAIENCLAAASGSNEADWNKVQHFLVVNAKSPIQSLEDATDRCKEISDGQIDEACISQSIRGNPRTLSLDQRLIDQANRSSAVCKRNK